MRRLRVHSHAAAAKVKLEGGTQRPHRAHCSNDSAFPLSQGRRSWSRSWTPKSLHRSEAVSQVDGVFGRGRGTASFCRSITKRKSPLS